MENPKNREIIKYFYKFLKKNKIEEKYVNNFLKYFSNKRKVTKGDMIAFIINCVQNEDAQGLLSSAFEWNETNEGSIYWLRISTAWKMYLYKNNFSY